MARPTACSPSRDDGVDLSLEVRDTGPGIAGGERERLFQPFVQLDASTTRRHGGTGLGLAITLRLVEALGGRIDVESEPGQGARFRVTVPLGHAPAAAPEPAAEAGGSTLRGHVLLADDNDINRRVIGRQLERLGMTVTAVADGRAAIDAAASGSFDAILMDCRMPGLDGEDATRAIRSLEGRGRRTPVIVITANALSEDRERIFAAGMDGIVTKPLTREDLRAALVGATTPPPALDLEALERLREELDDDALLASVLETYVEELDGRLDAIRLAHRASDGAGLADAAHVLAAPSAMVGLRALAESCRALARAAALPGRDVALDALEAEAARALSSLTVNGRRLAVGGGGGRHQELLDGAQVDL